MTQTNYNKKKERNQAEKMYEEKILKKLPKNMEETAKEYKAIERKRGIKSAGELLRIMIIYAMSNVSFPVLSAIAAATGVSEITDTAWRKQIRKSVVWLSFLLQYAISEIVPMKEISTPDRRNVYLIDATQMKQRGKDGKNYRVHMCYDLKNGRMREVKVTDHHTAESFRHFDIKANDIYIADAGYGKISQYEYVCSKKADIIFRITPGNFTIVNERGTPVNLFKMMRKTKMNQFDLKCYGKYKGKLFPIRIILSRIPEEKMENVLKRRKRQAQKKQTVTPCAKTAEYAKWVILATSLDSGFSVDNILTLYRSRWQIELLFKRFKQHLKISHIRKGSENYALAIVHLWLIIWAFVEHDSLSLQLAFVASGTPYISLSLWHLSSFAFFSFVAVLLNPDFFLFDDLLFLKKFLRLFNRDRVNHFAFFHDFSNLLLFSSFLFP